MILLLGKRLPHKGSEIGILAVGASFVLSIVAAVQWIDRVEDATGHSEGLRALGRSIFGAEAGGHAAEADRATGRQHHHLVAERRASSSASARASTGSS